MFAMPPICQRHFLNGIAEELLAKLETDLQQQNNWFQQNADMGDLGLRYYQEEAVQAVENAIVAGQQDILLAMATGTGKTRTAIALMYRLIQSQRFNRILFWSTAPH